MRENKTLALMLMSIVLACGGAGVYPSASETLTVWRTTTYTKTYISTSTIRSYSYVFNTSSVAEPYTYVGATTHTLTNYPAEIRQETAANYAIRALIIEAVLPPEFIPTDEHSVTVLMEIHYLSPRNMVLEKIGLSTWMDMRTSSAPVFPYVPAKVNVSEGAGSLYTWEFIHRNDTKYTCVYLSEEGPFPEILSVDLKRKYENAFTEIRTQLKPSIFLATITYTQTVEKTHTEIITERYATFETLTPPSTTGEATLTPTTTYIPPTTTVTTLTPTRTPSPIPGIDTAGFQVVIYAIIALVVASAVGLLIRRRRKAEAPHTPPTPSPI